MTPNTETAEFFLVALPGLEDLVQAELADWFPDIETSLAHGGVNVVTTLEKGLSMNLVLKTPTRILMRVASFRCRDFPKLFDRVSKLPWRKWIDPTCAIEVHASTRLSRLKMKKRIEETCLKAWSAYQKRTGVSGNKQKTANVYVRMLDDVCTLSLDTSGERLHKRGERQLVGEAPLRETIAASLIQLVGRSHASGATGAIEFIDPMMGSGVFLLEAASRDQTVEARTFAFETFAVQPDLEPKLRAVRPHFESLVGYEMDAKTLKAARENLSGIGDKYKLDLRAEDFFQARPLPEKTHLRWLFANPPYGERLKVKGPLGEFYARLFAATERVVSPDRACFILPTTAVKGRFDLPAAWKVLEKRPFLNGGIPVVAFIFGRRA